MRLVKRPSGWLKEPHPSPIPRYARPPRSLPPEGSDDDYDYDDDREGAGGFYNFKFLYIMKNINWKKIVEFAIAVLTALLGVLGANAMR